MSNDSCHFKANQVYSIDGIISIYNLKQNFTCWLLMKTHLRSMLIQVCLMLFLLHKSCCVDFIYHVEEGQNSGTYVGDIGSDVHLINNVLIEELGLVSFSQLEQDVNSSNQLFTVFKSGKLYTGQKLDAESLCKYNTECFRMVDVAVQKEESFIKLLEIKVIIEDANDHKPVFPKKQINLQFDEGDGKGMIKSIPNAIDKDVGVINSQITYQLEKHDGEPFTLSESKRVDGSSSLGITLENKLDREKKDTYMLKVIARDGGSPPKEGHLNVLITVTDVNDNPPHFSQNLYNVSVNNGYHKDMRVAQVSASDLDSGKNGQVSYYFSSKTSDAAKSNFALNENTGEIFLVKTFGQRKKLLYKLFIEARDHGSPPLSSIATVLVNVLNQQNNPPQIDVKFVSKSTGITARFSEGIKVGSFIAFVKVTDNDAGQNGEVTCDLKHDKFLLQSLGKMKYKVVVKNPVDRETESYINFTISCQDKGFPSLKTERNFSIQVMDINDVQPHFSKELFKFLTYENEKPFFPIGFINVTDQDLGEGGQLSYSLLDKNKHVLPFEISNFGFISTTQSLDREQQEIYHFQVFVKDNGTPSLNNTANVIIEVMDKNDNAPYFTFPSVNPFSLDIYYHPQSKKDITVLRASDRDSHVNAFLRYEILGGNDKQLFTINPYTGVLSFSRTVYQNDAGSYDLKFIVKDSGIPVLSTVTTLSLTLTVSNKTSKMLTPPDTKSDDKIHINLVIIILLAAVIVSVATVVSITVCIVRRNHQRNTNYRANVNTANKSMSASRQPGYDSEQMTLQYDVPVPVATSFSKNRSSLPSGLGRQSHPEYALPYKKNSLSGMYCSTSRGGSFQVAIPSKTNSC
ncbi:protocadherin beta-15 isoform X1 [Octopus bimaculoides]|uniref:protocadherin beta-15 isoform X1 n=2 Tax=Octopus bimaculoides TaxID=37653 RepID=UPI0022E6A73F|nr:protocadherin beta-15 isoform X1 [Octopus bimaculoides]